MMNSANIGRMERTGRYSVILTFECSHIIPRWREYLFHLAEVSVVSLQIFYQQSVDPSIVLFTKREISYSTSDSELQPRGLPG